MDPSAPDIENGKGVLVVGAGPVGLTAACELARHGARVRLIEAVACPQTALEIFAGQSAKERVRIGTDVASRYQQILNLPQSGWRICQITPRCRPLQ